MNSPIQFHSIHGEHVKLSKGNTVAKRIDSFCKGICFTQRPIAVREKIYVRLLSKSVQWTGFLRLGMTTCDPTSHRTSDALPRHACPDLTCRPGYWAKCVPENCFDLTNKLTYFYVDENGELFLNSPGGEISLLTGISVRDPLWGLLDIYGNCISIELVEDPQPRPQSLNGQMRSSNSTATMNYYQDLRSDLRPLTFLPVHNHSISFFSSSSTNQADKSIVLFDTKKSSDGLIYFTEPLSIRTGLLIEILRVLPSNESRSRSTTNATVSTSKSTHLQFGLTNCDIKTLYQQQNSVPLTINAINQREELWVIQDFPLANKTLDTNDEFLFVFAEEGIIYFSQNNSQFQDFLHLDPSLTYYPFLIFKGDVVAVRSAGFLRSLNKCRGLPRSTRNNETTASSVATASNDKTKSENSSKKSSQSKSNADCSICLDRERDTVLIPCGHICLCYACATHVQRFGERQCPICRSSIDLVNKIYLA